ncbi:MAG: hypothetical protein R3F37_18015 [Candidatus Competibacteraceae bacterium]
MVLVRGQFNIGNIQTAGILQLKGVPLLSSIVPEKAPSKQKVVPVLIQPDDQQPFADSVRLGINTSLTSLITVGVFQLPSLGFG